MKTTELMRGFYSLYLSLLLWIFICFIIEILMCLVMGAIQILQEVCHNIYMYSIFFLKLKDIEF